MRKKVKLAFIARDASRKVTFNKRKSSLLKKVRELSILCDVPACAIVYGEQGLGLDIWPPSPVLVRKVVSRFLEIPVMEQRKKMVNQEEFILDRVSKTEGKLGKLRKDNKEVEMACVMIRALAGQAAPGWLEVLTLLDLTDLEWVVDLTLKQVTHLQDKLSEAPAFEERTQVTANEAATLVEESTSIRHNQGRLQGLDDPMEQALLPNGISVNPSSFVWSDSFFP